ncbi:TlpA family protein disulfide reductase [Sphingobacterium griseoflavum]|uniref:Thiol:disulfide interchange protein n=1 Tax=Sphingobacterium griseoflavum TaxID=1474952 RepID=A0ABQ3HVG3_9SPHI|nr:TlpA disulfide reductase family protein [Sphingobacterium griseoflavum]GHE31845.1 thiol:disulfide interchange protein [Sphingobacterium griseoflavum]
MKLLHLITFLSVCSTAVAQVNKPFVVKGQIDTVPFAAYEACYYVRFDSLVIEPLILDQNSEFKLIGAIPEPTLVEIRYYKSEKERESAYLFWIEPYKEMDFHGKARSMGSKADRAYTLTNSETDRLQQRYSALRTALKKLDVHQQDARSKQFIRENIATYYALELLWYMLMKTDVDYDFLDEMMAILPSDLKNTNLAHDIRRKRNLVTGAQLPDIDQPDAEGRIYKISDYRGKYLLVDFWASWCVPCRTENPMLVKLYKQYQNQGFEILGISLDEDKHKWLQAVLDDGLLWKQVSDLKGFRGNKAGYELLVQGIPDNFLLDPEGRIIARGLRGEQIELFLKNIFERDLH